MSRVAVSVSHAFAVHTLQNLSQATGGDYIWSNICVFIEGLCGVKSFLSNKIDNGGNGNNQINTQVEEIFTL